jgi:hypothetical protein
VQYKQAPHHARLAFKGRFAAEKQENPRTAGARQQAVETRGKAASDSQKLLFSRRKRDEPATLAGHFEKPFPERVG